MASCFGSGNQNLSSSEKTKGYKSKIIFNHAKETLLNRCLYTELSKSKNFTFNGKYEILGKKKIVKIDSVKSYEDLLLLNIGNSKCNLCSNTTNIQGNISQITNYTFLDLKDLLINDETNEDIYDSSIIEPNILRQLYIEEGNEILSIDEIKNYLNISNISNYYINDNIKLAKQMESLNYPKSIKIMEEILEGVVKFNLIPQINNSILSNIIVNITYDECITEDTQNSEKKIKLILYNKNFVVNFFDLNEVTTNSNTFVFSNVKISSPGLEYYFKTDITNNNDDTYKNVESNTFNVIGIFSGANNGIDNIANNILKYKRFISLTSNITDINNIKYNDTNRDYFLELKNSYLESQSQTENLNNFTNINVDNLKIINGSLRIDNLMVNHPGRDFYFKFSSYDNSIRSFNTNTFSVAAVIDISNIENKTYLTSQTFEPFTFTLRNAVFDNKTILDISYEEKTNIYNNTSDNWEDTNNSLYLSQNSAKTAEGGVFLFDNIKIRFPGIYRFKVKTETIDLNRDYYTEKILIQGNLNFVTNTKDFNLITSGIYDQEARVNIVDFGGNLIEFFDARFGWKNYDEKEGEFVSGSQGVTINYDADAQHYQDINYISTINKPGEYSLILNSDPGGLVLYNKTVTTISSEIFKVYTDVSLSSNSVFPSSGVIAGEDFSGIDISLLKYGETNGSNIINGVDTSFNIDASGINNDNYLHLGWIDILDGSGETPDLCLNVPGKYKLKIARDYPYLLKPGLNSVPDNYEPGLLEDELKVTGELREDDDNLNPLPFSYSIRKKLDYGNIITKIVNKNSPTQEITILNAPNLELTLDLLLVDSLDVNSNVLSSADISFIDNKGLTLKTKTNSFGYGLFNTKINVVKEKLPITNLKLRITGDSEYLTNSPIEYLAFNLIYTNWNPSFVNNESNISFKSNSNIVLDLPDEFQIFNKRTASDIYWKDNTDKIGHTGEGRDRTFIWNTSPENKEAYAIVQKTNNTEFTYNGLSSKYGIRTSLKTYAEHRTSNSSEVLATIRSDQDNEDLKYAFRNFLDDNNTSRQKFASAEYFIAGKINDGPGLTKYWHWDRETDYNVFGEDADNLKQHVLWIDQ